MALRPGETIGPYRVVDEIGAGGMATVYKAFQPSLARHVAIKVLPGPSAHDPAFLDRFRQEATIIASLRHPNIVVVFDTGEEDGVPYIVMELIEGGTLADRLRGVVPLDETVALLRPIASALDFAHARGVVHRDVKPPNVLIGADGVPILSDFGIARILEANRQLTQTGMGLGTPEYMAPEQAMAQPVGPATDTYALGVIAYQMLTGTMPFSAPTPMAVAIAHAQHEVPPPRARNPALSDGVQRVLLMALAKRPEDRFASASALVEALAAADSGPELTVASVPPPSGAAPMRSTPQPQPNPGVARTVAAETVVNEAEPPRAPAARTGGHGHRRGARVATMAGAACVLLVLAVGAVALHAVSTSAVEPARPAVVVAPVAGAAPPIGASPSASVTPGAVLYADDFANPAAGKLPNGSPSPDKILRGYLDGEYQMKMLDPTLQTLVTALIPGSQTDATITVDGRLLGETGSRFIEIACRAEQENGGSQYRLIVDPTRRWFRLLRLDAGKLVPLVDWTPSAAIAAGQGTNHVELGCVGDMISAGINGSVVASVQDSTYRQGRMWIGLSSIGRVGEARFSNLRVVGTALADGQPANP